ncbi:hypothetical protein [Undibacterium sp. Di24W]|uniref:hypothetical protein n=1 Tax=Undibacterium sp. Di24W TaxID=3413033 RepID=UPI003BF3A7D6
MEMQQTKQDKYLNSLGWGGGIICLIAYGLNTQQLLASTSLTFLLMNVFGCCCLIYYTYKKQAFANTFLNGVYLLMTMMALFAQI